MLSALSEDPMMRDHVSVYDELTRLHGNAAEIAAR
jgi:hypothetical protein